LSADYSAAATSDPDSLQRDQRDRPPVRTRDCKKEEQQDESIICARLKYGWANGIRPSPPHRSGLRRVTIDYSSPWLYFRSKAVKPQSWGDQLINRNRRKKPFKPRTPSSVQGRIFIRPWIKSTAKTDSKTRQHQNCTLI